MQHPSVHLARWTALVGASLALAGCAPPAPEDGDQPPPVVTVSLPREQNVTNYSRFTGRTAAVDSVQVRARVWGYLQRINFTEGAEVKQGDVLFEIDASTYQTTVDQARARLTLAQAQLTLSEAEANRNNALRIKGVLAREDLEKSTSASETAAAAVDSARADVARARLDLGFTQVKAPVSGRVGRALVTVGNLVQSGEIGGTILTTIVSVDPMWANFDVDDLTYLRVSQMMREGKLTAGPDPRLRVELGLANEDGYPHHGFIDFMDNQVNPSTGTLQMRGVFANKDRVLTPGLFARIRVPLGTPHHALLVTDRAVDTDQGDKVLYVLNAENVVSKRPVRLGALHDGGQREVEDGLEAGERVVVDGIQRVRDGIKVEPHLVDMPVFPDVPRAAATGEPKKS
jgi:RND family efflux transporter MFP subunit